MQKYSEYVNLNEIFFFLRCEKKKEFYKLICIERIKYIVSCYEFLDEF